MQLLRSCTRALARRRYTNELHKSHQLQQRLIPSTPISLKDRQSSTVRNLSHHHYGVSPSRLDFKEHPQGWRTIQDQVEPYFAQHWKFPSEKARQAFFAVGFSQAFSQFFPLTLDERVEGTCKMHYLALLIDDQLEKMSLSDMLSYRERIIRIARGQDSADREVCIEWMLSDTLHAMRDIDDLLTSDLVEGFCTLLQAQTAQERLSVAHLGPYLAAREVDVGRTFYAAIIRYSAKLYLSPSELRQMATLESCAFRFMGVLNDIYSWDREWKVYQEDPTDGARPFSAVYILAQETGLSFPACKRLLYSYCRELELVLKQSGEEIERQNGGTLRPDVAKYIKGLEYLMSGIERWSQWTPRYK